MILKDWEEIRAAGPEAVGGKAWNLARLVRYGLPVPPGRVVPVAAYRHWLAASGLQNELIDAAGQPEAHLAKALAAVTARLADIPIGLDLSALPDGPLALRSSAPQEDGAVASFAGIHASCLNVQGGEAIEEAVRTVWLSLWSPAAVAYRQRLGFPHRDAAMAVLVMPLIEAKASGIAFTREPVSGRDDRIVIHAVRGLGESLVAGQATGDEIVLSEDHLDDGLSLLELKQGHQAVRTDPLPGGGTDTVPQTGTGPVLTEDAALALGEQLRLAALALDYARPDFDLEWAWDGTDFWLLQARPITAAARCTYPTLAAQPDIWSRGNTRDVVPDPLSPVDWGASRRLVNAILQEGFALAGLKLYPGVQRAGLFHGRLYLNMSLLQWEGFETLGVLPGAMNRLVGGHQPEIRVPAPTLADRLRRGLNLLRYMAKAPRRRRAGCAAIDAALATAARWNHEALPADDAGFAAALRAHSRYGRGARNLHFLQGSASGALNFLVDIINKHLPGEGHALAAALMAGAPHSVTAEEGYALIAIARQAVADADSRAWLERRRDGGDGDWQALPADNPLRRDFAAFLERYGHRGVYETYTRNPRWREQPGYLLDNLLTLAETDLEAQQARQSEARARALARVHAAMPWWKRPMLAGMVRAAKEGSNEREAARSAIISLLEPGRRLLLALGARWVDAGWLAAADEIFFLLQAEIYAVIDGNLPGPAIAPRVADRRRLCAAWQAEEAPDVILEQPDGSLAERTDDGGLGVGNTWGDRFRGVPVGTGIATSTACLLRSPEQGALLERGGILVVPSTDPAWTPLFLKAGGLVMETGGYLSHGAIVAREFGIPAVVNLPGILDRLASGDRLEVDGNRGVVTRLK